MPEETKYCNVWECLKKNDRVKGFVVSTVTEKTERVRIVESILNALEEKYARTTGEKIVSLMEEISEFKIEGDVEKVLDKFEKIMVDMKKLDLIKNLNFAILLQYIERLKKSGKISSEERLRLKDEIETKEGGPRVIDPAERVRNELKNMKIVKN